MSCDVGVYCFVWLIMHSPSRAILSFRRSLEVEAVHLDSVMETLSLPAHLDAALGFVQSSILDEHRWPLRFSALLKHLPVLWSTWCAVYSLCAQLLCLCSLRRRSSSRDVACVICWPCRTEAVGRPTCPHDYKPPTQKPTSNKYAQKRPLTPKTRVWSRKFLFKKTHRIL